MTELDLDQTLERGRSGADVKRVQEWLCLHGYAVQLDGVFGAATKQAVQRLQAASGLEADGLVSRETFAVLVAPMRAALQRIEPAGRSLGALAVAYARQHLAQHAREVGGPNGGPWVRLYMNGHEGREWLWCAGFVSYVLRQAADTLQVESPLPRSFSCDVLALAARSKGMLVDGDLHDTPAKLRPGSLFLVRRSEHDWKHVGFVSAAASETFDTVEGNSNDGGGRNGVEVASNTRSYVGRDFVLLG